MASGLSGCIYGIVTSSTCTLSDVLVHENRRRPSGSTVAGVTGLGSRNMSRRHTGCCKSVAGSVAGHAISGCSLEDPQDMATLTLSNHVLSRQGKTGRRVVERRHTKPVAVLPESPPPEH